MTEKVSSACLLVCLSVLPLAVLPLAVLLLTTLPLTILPLTVLPLAICLTAFLFCLSCYYRLLSVLSAGCSALYPYFCCAVLLLLTVHVRPTTHISCTFCCLRLTSILLFTPYCSHLTSVLLPTSHVYPIFHAPLSRICSVWAMLLCTLLP